MNLYIVIEKICGDPSVSLVTTTLKNAETRFLQLIRETECPNPPSDEELLAEGAFDYGDDCCVYIKVIEGRDNTVQRPVLTSTRSPGDYEEYAIHEQLDQLFDGISKLERWEVVTRWLRGCIEEDFSGQAVIYTSLRVNGEEWDE